MGGTGDATLKIIKIIFIAIYCLDKREIIEFAL